MEIGESFVKSIILHQIGNRLREEPLVLADECFSITESISNLILGGYLKGVVSEKNKYVLSHESDIALNDVAYHTSVFFRKKTSFVELSQKLASHLYSSAHHPNIASGDLFIILFEALKLDGAYKSGIGVFKSESRQQYLSASTDGKTNQLKVSSGINPDLIDKGVLIVDGSETIYAVDRLSSRTKYWIEDFLKAKQVPNESAKLAVVASLIDKVQGAIESPADRQDFCRDVIVLCSDGDEVLGEDIKVISEKYVSAEVWSTELEKIVERKGLVDTGEIKIPAKNLQAKLRKIFNRINLGHDVSLIVPDNLIFSGVDFNVSDGMLRITVSLESKNG